MKSQGIGSRVDALASPKATKKPESADRVRAPCTARYDAVRSGACSSFR